MFGKHSVNVDLLYACCCQDLHLHFSCPMHNDMYVLCRYKTADDKYMSVGAIEPQFYE